MNYETKAIQMKRYIYGLALIFVLCGCSDDPDPVIPSDNANGAGGDVELDAGDVGPDGSDASDVDGLDSDSGDVGDSGEASDVSDIDEEDVEEVDEGPCGPVIDLGILEDGYEETITVDFGELTNALATGCENAVDGPEAVFSFELADEGTLKFTSETPLAMEVREAACDDESAVFCAESNLDLPMAPGGIFYIAVENLQIDPSQEVEIDVRFVGTPICDELGASECLNNDILRSCNVTRNSPDIPRWGEFECPAGCENDRCLGDSCATALEVTDSLEITGSQVVLFDEQNSLGSDFCGAEGFPGANLGGRELVFELPGLNPSKQVEIQALHSEMEFSILVKDSCEDQTMCLGYWEGEDVHIFEPSSPGTYYLFVDTPFNHEGSFYISIEIQ